MIQVMYEYTQPWPENGALNLESPPSSLEVPVSPDSARRCVNGYLGMHVSMALEGADPILVLNEQAPRWRVALNLIWPGLGFTSTLGHIDVDAKTREVIPLSDKKILEIQDKVNDILTCIAPDTTRAS